MVIKQLFIFLIIWLAACAALLAQSNPFITSATNAPAVAAKKGPASAPKASVRTGPARGADLSNPFVQATFEAYVGRFRSGDIQLQLKPDGKVLQGTLQYQGGSYHVKAALTNGRVKGDFGEGRRAWPFSAVSDGKELTFATEGITNKLQRVTLPKLEGVYQSDRVWLTIAQPSGKYTGALKYSGKEYPFTAAVLADDLEGTFVEGTRQYPFTLVVETNGLVFRTATFVDVLKLAPRTGKLAINVKPPTEFCLLNDGKKVSGVSNVYEFPAGQALKLVVQAKGFLPAKTNLVLAAYSESAWSPELEPIPHPTLGLERWTNVLGMVFVPVPKTQVLFCIWDTRVQDYQAFVTATGRDGKKAEADQGPKHPVINVSWEEAKAFCEWLTTTNRAAGSLGENQRYRLPTDIEWSLAVGLDSESGATPKTKDGKIKGLYPWGTRWPPPAGTGNFHPSLGIDDFAKTSPVGSFKPNKFGLYDMSGNIWQWCEDWYDSDQQARVLRGGSWINGNADRLLSSARDHNAPENHYGNAGFRCVLLVGDEH